MVKHNNVIPYGHFKKYGQNYVKTWFNQPARKKRRRTVHQKKAIVIFPRPVAGALRPVIRSQTVRYNSKVRAGRGFTFEELKGKTSTCLESLQANIARLNTYKAKLVASRGGPAGDSTPEELVSAMQLQGHVLPIQIPRPVVELVSITKEMKNVKAYSKLQVERMNARLVGIRKKKAAEAEKEEKK